MWPANFWKLYEYFIRKSAGLGRSPTEPDKDIYDHRYLHCDVLIVGGGISGLYMYMNLLQKTSNICLLEKNDYFGGRIKQCNDKISGKNISFPEGAARFNNNHKKVIKLLKQFNLFDSQKTPNVSSDIDFIDTENEFSNKFNGENGFKYINKILEKYHKYDKQELQNMTFQELGQKILKKTELEFMLKSSGYTGQLKNMNSYDAFNFSVVYCS